MEKTSLFLSVFLAILLIPIASAKPSITIISPLNQTYYNGTAPLNVSSNETVNITVRLNEAVFEWYNVSGVNTIVYGEETFLLNATVENENGTNYKSLVFTVVDGAHSIDVTSCGILATPGEYYLLNDLIDTTHSDGQSCFTFNTSGIIFRCNNHLIDGGTTVFGNYYYGTTAFKDLGSFNSIDNCRFSDFAYIGLGSYGTIDRVNYIRNVGSVSSPANGVLKNSNLKNTTTNIGVNSSIYNNTINHLKAYTSTNSTIINNTIGYFEIAYTEGMNVTENNFNNAGVCVEIRDGAAHNYIYNNYLNCSLPIKDVHTCYYARENYFNVTRHSGQRIYSNGDIGGNYYTNTSGGYSNTCYDTDRDGFCDEPLLITVNCPNKSMDYLPYSDCYGTTADWQVTVEKTQINSTHRMVNETYVDLTGCEPPYSVIRYEIHPILFNTIAFVMAAGFLLMLVRDFFAVDNPRNMINFLLAITIIFIVMVSAMQLLL